jgi:hypothetical protein
MTRCVQTTKAPNPLFGFYSVPEIRSAYVATCATIDAMLDDDAFGVTARDYALAVQYAGELWTELCARASRASVEAGAACGW